MSIDVIGDFLTIIRNGVMVRRRSVTVPYSNLKNNIAQVLKDEGFIKDFEKVNVPGSDALASLTIFLKYVDGESVIHEIKRVSKPSRRHYERMNNLTSVIGGLGISILSTSSGIMTDRQAQKLSVGGEVICHVW